MLLDVRPFDSGLALTLADTLLRYKRVSYGPDVRECQRAMEGIPGVREALEDFTTRKRELDKQRMASRAGAHPRDTGRDQEEEQESSDWSDVRLVLSILGHQITLAPLWDVWHLPVVRDSDGSAAALDGRNPPRVAFRVFQNRAGSPDLHLAALARALSLDVAAVLRRLRETSEISWRALSDVPGEDDRGHAAHFFGYGTRGSTDIRLVGSSDGMLEAIVASDSEDAARTAVKLLVDVFGEGAPELPRGGIGAVVLQESTDHSDSTQ